MVGFEIGRIVFSKCGRDKGLPFVVLKVEGEFVYLADGKLRNVNNPKKKKMKHVQITKTVNSYVQAAVCSNKTLLDSDLRKAVTEFVSV